MSWLHAQHTLSNSNTCTALVAEGGGMRGAFTAGVLDAFLLNGYNPFDLFIGCSAGAMNLSSYLAGQYRHGYRTILNYTTKPEFYNWKGFLRGGHAIDLDWLWQETDKTNPLDVDQAIKSLGQRQFLVGLTHAHRGEASYHCAGKPDWQNLLKASAAIPVLYRSTVTVKNQPYVDGGVADPIPVKEAWLRGARRIVVIRTHSHSYREQRSWREQMLSLLVRSRPAVAEQILQQESHYNIACQFIENPPRGVEVIEIAPDKELSTPILSRNRASIQQDYQAGCEAGLRYLYDEGVNRRCSA